MCLTVIKNGRTGNRKTKIITKEIAAGKQKFIIPDYIVKLRKISGGHFGLSYDPVVTASIIMYEAIFKKKSQF